MAEPKDQMHEHWLSRDYETSARLYFQHWLFQSTLGHLVDDAIVTEWEQSRSGGDSLRVADLACGNAAWLFDLANEAPNTLKMDVELYGFDIQPSHFPAAACTPSNVHLVQQDILRDSFPEELIESFDLVHVRAFTSLIMGDNVSPLCQAAMKLLKPGGYLQWEESDQANLVATIGGKAAPQGTKLTQLIIATGKAMGMTYSWNAVMGQKVEAEGFQNVVFEKHPLKRHQGKAWTENYLLAFRDVGYMLPSEKDAPGSPLTRESYNALFASVTREATEGLLMHTGNILTVIGKK